jgi:soluble cytochrome b562
MVDWTTIILSVLLATVASIITSLATTEYRIRRENSVEQSEEVEKWYREAKEYSSEVKKRWRRSYDITNPDIKEIKNEMDLFAGQISSHATKGESLKVDKQVISALDDLAEECKVASKTRATMGSKSKFDDVRDSIFETADKVEEKVESR